MIQRIPLGNTFCFRWGLEISLTTSQKDSCKPKLLFWANKTWQRETWRRKPWNKHVLLQDSIATCRTARNWEWRTRQSSVLTTRMILFNAVTQHLIRDYDVKNNCYYINRNQNSNKTMIPSTCSSNLADGNFFFEQDRQIAKTDSQKCHESSLQNHYWMYEECPDKNKIESTRKVDMYCWKTASRPGIQP